MKSQTQKYVVVGRHLQSMHALKDFILTLPQETKCGFHFESTVSGKKKRNWHYNQKWLISDIVHYVAANNNIVKPRI